MKRYSTYTTSPAFEMLMEEIDIPSGSDDDVKLKKLLNVEPPFNTKVKNLSDDLILIRKMMQGFFSTEEIGL